MTDPRIEAAACALCESNGNDPDGNDCYVQSGMGANWRAYEDEARAALAAADAVAWRPIATAPTDSSEVLLWDGYSVSLSYWIGDCWWSDIGCCINNPTRWQHTPKGPTT